MEPLAGTHLKAGGIGFTQSQQERRRPADRRHQSLGTPTLERRRRRRRVTQILLSDEVRCAQLSSFRASECVVVAAVEAIIPFSGAFASELEPPLLLH